MSLRSQQGETKVPGFWKTLSALGPSLTGFLPIAAQKPTCVPGQATPGSWLPGSSPAVSPGGTWSSNTIKSTQNLWNAIRKEQRCQKIQAAQQDWATHNPPPSPGPSPAAWKPGGRFCQHSLGTPPQLPTSSGLLMTRGKKRGDWPRFSLKRFPEPFSVLRVPPTPLRLLSPEQTRIHSTGLSTELPR